MPRKGVVKIMCDVFFLKDKPAFTVMVQAENPKRIKQLIDSSLPLGADAFGMQFERLNAEYKSEKTFRELFAYAKDVPTYATNYRNGTNEGKTDEELAKEMLFLAECGANLCDIMGDLFDRQDDEVAKDPVAIKRQTELIEKLHSAGAKVLMSSHVMKFTPKERVMEIALEHQKRGADICKIVTGADNAEQELENLKIINMLKENLQIPFLFLCVNHCNLLRRVGGNLGNCMNLCVFEHDNLSTPAQPLLTDAKKVYELIDFE